MVKAICPICGKEFKKTKRNQKYCHNPCSYDYNEKRKYVGLTYHQIKVLRSKFFSLSKSNPEKALEFREQMIAEEGKEFANLALGNIIESDLFKKLETAHSKYKHLWSS